MRLSRTIANTQNVSRHFRTDKQKEQTMAVILKKDEKIKAIIDLLPENFETENFIDKFKETYPKDWKKLELTYSEHVKNTKPGKPIPMPKPEQYLKNSLNVWNKSNKK